MKFTNRKAGYSSRLFAFRQQAAKRRKKVAKITKALPQATDKGMSTLNGVKIENTEMRFLLGNRTIKGGTYVSICKYKRFVIEWTTSIAELRQCLKYFFRAFIIWFPH